MANGTDYRVNIIGDAKELLKEMEVANKQAKKNFKQHNLLKQKFQRTQKQQAAAEKRAAASQYKIQKKHVAELQKMEKKGWTERQVQQRKQARQLRAEQRELRRYRREQNRYARSQRWDRFKNNRGVRAGVGIAGGIAGFMIGGGISSYQKHMELVKAQAPLMGLAKDRGGAAAIRNALAGRGRGYGSDLGFNQAETAKHAGMMARATGTISPGELQQFVRGSGTGMSVGEGAEIFGAFRKAGMSFEKGPGGISQGTKQLQRSLAIAVQTGLERGRFPEFAKGVVSLLAAQGSMLAGRISAEDTSKTMGLLALTGKEGFKGERGAALAAKLHQGILKPGGGEYGQAFTLRAMGFHGGEGGVGYMDALRRQQQGLNPENLQRIARRELMEYGSGDKGQLHMSETYGIGLDYAKEILEGVESGTISEARLEEISKKSEPFEKQSLDNMKEMGVDLKHIAGYWDQWAVEGKKFAPAIQKLQQFQQEIFGTMVDLLTDIRDGVRRLVDWWTGGTESGTGALADGISAEKKAQAEAASAGSLGDHIKALKKREAALGKIVAYSGEKYGGGMKGDIDEALSYLPGVDLSNGLSKAEQQRAKDDLARVRSVLKKEESAHDFITRMDAGILPEDFTTTGSLQDMPSDFSLEYQKLVAERALDRAIAQSPMDQRGVATDPNIQKLHEILDRLDRSITAMAETPVPVRVQRTDARQPSSPR